MRPPDPATLQPFLDRLVLRSRLGAAEQRAIRALPARPAQVQANRDFVRIGERVHHACFVLAGLVGRFAQSREGTRQITAVHIPSDMIDLHSVVVPEAGSALQALSVTTILRIPHESLRDAAQRYPAIAEAFWRECVVDAAVLAQWVVNVGRRDARSRICHLLCEVACRVTGLRARTGTSIPFPATQSHIADMTGLTAVHVNRTLQALRQEGVVDLHSRMVHILDWKAMVRIGAFDAGYLHLAGPANDLSVVSGA